MRDISTNSIGLLYIDPWDSGAGARGQGAVWDEENESSISDPTLPCQTPLRLGRSPC